MSGDKLRLRYKTLRMSMAAKEIPTEQKKNNQVTIFCFCWRLGQL